MLINPAEDGYRVYTAAADNEVAAYGLFILPQAAITAPLDGGGRGTITLPEDRPVADLFEDAALLPAQHIETFESDALSPEPTSVVPGFRLRVRAAGEEVGWIPAVDTHTAETAYVVVRWADGDVICETNDPAGVVDLGSTIKSLTVSLHG